MIPSLTLPRDPLAIAADRLDAGTERGRQERERLAAAADVRVFARYARILHPERGEIPFKPWRWQPDLLHMFATTRLLVILKARQLGVSWLAAIYALWVAMKPGKKVLLISKGQDEADDLLAKVTFIFDRLPEWLRPFSRRNTSELEFPDLASSIESFPATEGVGRSKTASVVIIDEHGHQRWARKIFLALKPVVENGQLISISSANGQGALHTHIYLNGKPRAGQKRGSPGPNGFVSVFIPWSAHPERDAYWRERARAEMSDLDDAEFAQEYPANDTEAFIVSGRPVFRAEDITAQSVVVGKGGETGVTYFADPEPGKVYVIGADTSEGLAQSNWCYAEVLERDSGDQVAVLAGRWAPDVYAAKLDRLARHYGQHASRGSQTVIVGVERNNHGHAVILELRHLSAGGAPYAIYRAWDKHLGWPTTSATRPVMVDQLEAALRTKALTVHDAGTVDQLGTFAYNDDGRPEAQEGYHDDAVLALAIAWQLRRRAFGRTLDVSPGQRKAAA